MIVTDQACEIVALHTDENDEPDWQYTVGVGGVTQIKHVVENYGDHGIPWFNVFTGERVYASVQAKAVARVIWKE